MTAIAFAIAACYLAWFYFFMDYGIEKEIYGLLLMAAIVLLAVILVSYGNVRPRAIFPKWSTLRRRTESLVRRFI